MELQGTHFVNRALLCALCGLVSMALWVAPSFCDDAAPNASPGAGDFYGSAGKQQDYYSDVRRGKEGFYGYEPVKKKEEKKEEDKKAGAAPPEHRMPDMKDYPVEKLWTMHPDDFQALLNDFQKKAVTTLKEDDVRDFWFMQDIARRRSLAFANVTAEVMQKTPSLNVEKDYPTNTPGRNSYVVMQRQAVSDLIKGARDEYGIIYFYKEGCPYCEAQDGINRLFVNEYGWDVTRIDIERSPELAARFGVEMTPSMYLIYKNNLKDFFPVSSGVTTEEDMKENIYRGMRILKGESVPENFSEYGFEEGSAFDALAPLKGSTGTQ